MLGQTRIPQYHRGKKGAYTATLSAHWLGEVMVSNATVSTKCSSESPCIVAYEMLAVTPAHQLSYNELPGCATTLMNTPLNPGSYQLP